MSDLYPLVYSTLGCPDWTLDHAASQAARYGYAGLEVRILDGEIIRHDLSAERRREIKATMARHGVVIAGLGLSTRFSSADAAERQSNLEQLRAYLELANDLEVPMVRTFGGAVPDGSSIAEVIDRLASSLAEAMPAADQQGVDIVLETHDAFCRGQEVAAVLQQVPHPRLGAVWDVHHPFRMGESIEETWRLIGARVKHIHLKDARLLPDGEWQLVLMGEGEVPCREIVELLYREGYAGYLAVEWEKKWHPEIETPEVAMPQHASVVREWMAELAES